MPKRKKLPEIPNFIDVGHNPNELLVQKSNPLQSLSETSMTLPELKILDAYLSRINSHDEEARFVRFEKGELEKLLGVTRILKDDLSKRLDNLFQAITIHDDNKKNGFTKIGLFEKAICEQDENGLWQVDLACSPSAIQYVFNIDNLGYLKYRLHNVINLTSRYSYVLYLYLEQNKFRKSWSISFEELKKLLKCTGETYTAYYRFNDLVFKKCQKEILEKTDIKYTYEPLKKGRKVVEVKFTIETLSDIENQALDAGQMMLLDDECYLIDDKLGIISDACKNEFTQAQMEEIFQNICNVSLPADEYGIDIARYHYVAKLYAKLNTATERAIENGKPIKNRYKYFITLIKNNNK